MPRIIIVNPFGIGDVLFSMPLVSVLKKNFPDAYIGYMCNRRAYDILKAHPALDAIFVYEKDDFRSLWRQHKMACIKKVRSFLRDIKRHRFDTAIDLSLGYQYSMCLKLVGIKRRIGFNYRDRGRFLTDKVMIDGFHAKHVVEYYLDLLRLLNLRIEEEDNVITTYVADADRAWASQFLRTHGVRGADLVVGVIPGCGASWGEDAVCRRWGREKFARVVDSLAEQYGAKVVLFGDPNEVGICEGIVGMVKHAPLVSCGKTTLGQFMALLGACALVVTNDGGPLHIAASLGIKTVSIFGPVDEKVYGPYPPTARHITVTGDAACRPCYKNFKYVRCVNPSCLDTIGPEKVLEAVENLMGHA